MDSTDQGGASPLEPLAGDSATAEAVDSAQVSATPGDVGQQKVVANEALYRDVNDQLEGLAAGETLAICCECGEIRCALPLEIARAEYARIREDPLQFIILPGHEQPAYETIVETTVEYEVVRKYPSASAVA